MNRIDTTLTKPGCIKQALSVIGDKWTALLLSELCAGPMTFGDLEKATSGISPRTLSQRLEMLQSVGVIVKDEYCERPKRCNYRLTEKGRELKVILEAMADWSEKHGCC